jgi:hypothetical protein
MKITSMIKWCCVILFDIKMKKSFTVVTALAIAVAVVVVAVKSEVW